MKKILETIVRILLCVIFLATGGALALNLYYQERFPLGTWFNGLYCTGKTVQEANELLYQSSPNLIVRIVDKNGSLYEMPLDKDSFHADYTEDLTSYQNRLNVPFLWLDTTQSKKEYTLLPKTYTYKMEAIREAFLSLPFVKEELEWSTGVTLAIKDGVYTLIDGNKDRLDIELALQKLEANLSKGQFVLDLSNGTAYKTLDDTEADQSVRDIWAQINNVYSKEIRYDMGDSQIPITKELLTGFITLEDGAVKLNESAIREWVHNLALEYDTVKTTKSFVTTEGRTVEVPYVKYGTQLDQDAEISWLLDTLQGSEHWNVSPLKRVPKYKQQGVVRGKDDIGSTYIEIDLKTQTMYYYENGVCKIETAIVSGDMKNGWDTPVGINYVQTKQRNRTLRGPGYESFVKYWMPVNGGIGIHDASWRSKFGGEIYLKNGSHGCINTPSKIMTQLYNMVKIGTPVIMFY